MITIHILDNVRIAFDAPTLAAFIASMAMLRRVLRRYS